jgi:membrane associated rhomboid family serine protease
MEANQWVMAAKAGYTDLADYSLVLSAVGIDHQVNRAVGAIFTRQRDAGRAMAELQSFREENSSWPPPPAPVRPAVQLSGGPPTTLLMFTCLVLWYRDTGPWLSDNPWFLAGAVDSRAILEQGEWWRLLTALTLHADQMHLVGNCIIGGFIVHLLCRTVGYGMGWFALLFSAMFGNLLNIVLRDAPHYSVGFSTAVFAAIGILCGRQLTGRAASLIRQLLLPLGAGIGLLAMLGSSGERTDLGAHLFGLGSGLLFGFLLRLTDLDLPGSRRGLQRVLFALSLLLILFCWLAAFAAGETG